MALAFTFDDGKIVNFGSAAALDNLTDFSYIVWFRRTGALAQPKVMMEKGTFGGSSRKGLLITNNDVLKVVVDRADTNAEATSTTDLTLNKWFFVAFTYESSDGPRIFIGDLATLAVEDDGTPTVGVGAEGDNSADNLEVGASSEGGTRAVPADIAIVAVFNKKLSLGEIHRQQFRPHVTPDSLIFSHLGFNGTGTQPDWSGNGNSGAVTGATVADHVPLGQPFGFDVGMPYEVAAAPTGQVITIIMGKLLIPFFWLKQGSSNRRGFIRNTLASILGW